MTISINSSGRMEMGLSDWMKQRGTSQYEKHGYANRRQYLIGLACEYGLPQSDVFTIASMLGRSEDFDGLISALEDMID
jgi:hypothetical protein